MRIIHVIDSLDIGGAEMLLVNYIWHYKMREPSSSHVLVVLKNNNTLLPRIEKSLDKFVIIQFNKSNILTGIINWRRLVLSFRPDLVHTHLFYATMLARWGTPKNIPIVSTYHNQSYCKTSPYYSPWFGRLDRFSFGKNHWRIFVSQAVQECIENSTLSKRNSRLIGNFVSTRFCFSWTLNSSRRGLSLVAIGSLKKVKNHNILVDALALIPHAPVTIDIYGEGELRSSLQKSIDEKGVHINLKGNQNLNSNILKDYDAFIMPSISEGQPVSLLEAMSTGLPSLLSDISSLKCLAGEAALYFSSTSPRQLAEQITRVLENKRLLIPLSKEAVKRAEPYSINNYFELVTKLYQTALSQKN